MPNQALVAFGVALGIGLLVITSSAWCSGLNTMKAADRQLTGKAPQKNTQQSVEVPAPPLVLTLEESLARALRHNPTLAVFSHEVEARELEALQAGFYPNPELSIEMENFVGSGDFSGTESAETTVLVSQRFELGDKRRQRQAVGRLDKKLVEHEYAAARVELVAETTTRFVAVLAAQHRLTLAEEQSDLASKVLATVDERIAAGKTANIERLQFQTLLVESQLRHEQAKQNLTTVRHSLAALWNQEEIDFSTVKGVFEQLPTLPELSDLSQKLPQSPTIIIQQTAVLKAGENLALEQAKSIPDLILSVGGKNFKETNDHALVAGVAISLPLFDRNQGGIGAAQARQAQALKAARAAQISQKTALREIWQRLQLAHREANLLRHELLPAVQKSFDAITYGYQVGKFGYLEVLDAEQALFEAKSRYIDSLTTCHQTYAELEQLLGHKFIRDERETTASTPRQRGQS